MATATRIPYAHTVISIEGAMPRLNTRDEHPRCADCPAPAEVTLKTKSDVGGGYLDLCGKDFEQRLATEPGFLARVVAGLVRNSLKAA